MPPIPAEGKHPVRLSPARHLIARNEHDGHVLRIESAHENRFARRSQVGGDAERRGLAPELGLCHLHDAPLVGGLDGLEEIRPGSADIDFRLEAAPLERHRQAVDFASARPRRQEDGGGVAPELELEGRRRLERWIRPGQRHHDAGRPAGELGGLVEIGRRRLEGSRRRRQRLLEAQRVAAVLVIARVAAEFPVAALAVARDRGRIGLVHFQPDRAAAALHARRLPRRRAAWARRRARPCAARPRSNRAAPPRSAAGTARSRCRRAGRRPSATITSAVGDAQEMPQAAAGQVVGGEDAVLERDRARRGRRYGLAEANRRRGSGEQSGCACAADRDYGVVVRRVISAHCVAAGRQMIKPAIAGGWRAMPGLGVGLRGDAPTNRRRIAAKSRRPAEVHKKFHKTL